ncbi:MAG: hypothetical protein ACJATS_000039, partial [Psychroserpens sp.]
KLSNSEFLSPLDAQLASCDFLAVYENL